MESNGCFDNSNSSVLLNRRYNVNSNNGILNEFQYEDTCSSNDTIGILNSGGAGSQYASSSISGLNEDTPDFGLRAIGGLTSDKHKTDNKTDNIVLNVDGYNNVPVNRERIRNIAAKKIQKYFTRGSKFSHCFDGLPDFKRLTTLKILKIQRHINRIGATQHVFNSGTSRINLKGKIIKHFNFLITIQPLNMSAMLPDRNSENENNDMSSDSDSQMSESERYFPPQSYRTPEKQRIPQIDASTLRSKIQTGILFAPNNYKGNLDEAKVDMTNAKNSVCVMAPNLPQKPVIYEIQDTQHFDFKTDINKRNVQIPGVRKLNAVGTAMNEVDENMDFMNVICRPRKQARYNRKFLYNNNDCETNGADNILSDITPRRKLLHTFQEEEEENRNLNKILRPPTSAFGSGSVDDIKKGEEFKFPFNASVGKEHKEKNFQLKGNEFPYPEGCQSDFDLFNHRENIYPEQSELCSNYTEPMDNTVSMDNTDSMVTEECGPICEMQPPSSPSTPNVKFYPRKIC